MIRGGRRLAVLLAVVTLGACTAGDTEFPGVDGKDVKPLEEGVVPGELLGLKVASEDATATLATFRATYLEAFSLFSLRRGEQLEATLQVGRMAKPAAEREDIRNGVIAMIGGSRPARARYGTDIVHLTKSTRQQVAVWFDQQYLFVLSVREDFDRPRSLLRAALAIDPKDVP